MNMLPQGKAGSRAIWSWSALTILTIGAVLLTGNTHVPFSSDYLYGSLFTHFNTLHFRTPPANYAFPDLLFHYLALLGPDSLLDQSVLAGVLQLLTIVAVTTWLLGVPTGAAVALFLLLICPNEVLATVHHLSMIVLFALYSGLRNLRTRLFILLLAVASDPLFMLLWLALTTLDRRIPGRIPLCSPTYRNELVIVLFGYSISFFVSESNIELIQAFVLFSFGLVVQQVILSIKTIRILVRTYRAWLALLAALLLIGINILVSSELLFFESRYVLPIAVCLGLFGFQTLTSPKTTFWTGKHHWPQRLAASILVTASIATSFLLHTTTNQDFFRLDARLSAWKCADAEISSLGIQSIAADYWDSKPLYVAALENGHDLKIVQIDFVNNMPDTWIAPYNMARGQAGWAIRDDRRCDGQQHSHCNYENQKLGRQSSSISICDRFTLIEYAETLPNQDQLSRFSQVDSKLSGFLYNFSNNLAKATGRLDR